jgi:hypothetical protein
VPGQSARILRHVMYGLIGLPEPGEVAGAWTVPAPRTVSLHPSGVSMEAVP